MPFSPLAQPVFSPRAGGGEDVRMRDADDDIENRTPNRVSDAASQASVGSRSSSARRASVTGSSSSDQTLSSLRRPPLVRALLLPVRAVHQSLAAARLTRRFHPWARWGALESLLQGSKEVQQARQTAPARQERLRP
jgi:hypothetical protein